MGSNGMNFSGNNQISKNQNKFLRAPAILNSKAGFG